MNAEEEARACGLCGDPEFRIDGYCSIYCRDVHGEMEEAAALRSVLSDLLEAAERVGGADRAEVVVGPYPDLASALDDLVRATTAARSVLGENP